MKVRFTPSARAQFLAALDYVRADDPQVARDLHDRAAASLSRLARFPESGRVVPESAFYASGGQRVTHREGLADDARVSRRHRCAPASAGGRDARAGRRTR